MPARLFALPQTSRTSSEQSAQSATIPSRPPSPSYSLDRWDASDQFVWPVPGQLVDPAGEATQEAGDSERMTPVDSKIRRDVENKILEVKAEAFTRALLYGDEAKQVRDFNLAEACLDALRTKTSADPAIQDLLKDGDLPVYVDGSLFPYLSKASSTSELYTPYLKLLNFINAFFRQGISDVDEAWPVAVDPNPTKSSPRTASTRNFLRRDFFDTRNSAPEFSRFGDERADLKPAICLILHQGQDATEPPPKIHWKDIKVPIEIKMQKEINIATVVQTARDARALLAEQFDRKFAYTVTLTNTECRVFHWDTVGCRVTEPINIYNNPVLFLWVMGRLATMTPTELGYDDHFSNAGRAMFSQALTTTLTIHESGIRQFFEHKQPSPSECPSASPPLVLELDTSHFLFESRASLLDRVTRVWRGVVVENTDPWTTGASRVIKQDWADDARPNEGYFYQLAKGIPGVTQLLRMEECDYTMDYHYRVNDKDVIGVLGVVKPSRKETRPRPSGRAAGDQGAANKGAFHFGRVLLRFVFEQEGRPLSQARDSVEVLEGVVQWIDALIALDKVGIVHRDISIGNLLLPMLSADGSAEGRQATIIDLGVALLKARSEDIPSQPQDTPGRPATAGEEETTDASRNNQHRPHVTGTLPFIALDLLRQLNGFNSSLPEWSQHGIHHDVESIVWVVVYLCMEFGGNTVKPWTRWPLECLTSSSTFTVMTQKTVLLLTDLPDMDPESLNDIGGRFAALEGFLEDFVAYYRTRRGIRKPIDASEVRALAAKHRDILKRAQESAEVDARSSFPSTQSRISLTGLENLRRAPPKRTYSARESERSSDGEGEVRPINEEEEPERPTKKRKRNRRLPLGSSTNTGNLR
ncbi:hypothetical protein FRC04_010047 [Tulasnella sp. 424]|nr:hypothetical protein FRC04_010047 [Tulasnella sp. 424]KAG8972837.1 hypothetical protein FRC05_009559 [Tulasnella sp. 425]